jgi:hypothetical protein
MVLKMLRAPSEKTKQAQEEKFVGGSLEMSHMIQKHKYKLKSNWVVV